MNAFLTQLLMEWRLQWRRPFVWFALGAYFLLSFGSTLEFAFGHGGYSWANGADAIASRALIISVLGIIVAAGVMADAICRDTLFKTEESILSTGVNVSTFYLAKFLSAFAVISIIGLTFFPGTFLASLLPNIPDERIGPIYLSFYAKAFVIYILPNLFLVSALIYIVAVKFRSQTIAFMVALALIAAYVMALMLLGQDVYRHDVFKLYALFDPYGNIASAEHAITWTVTENNTQFRPFSGLLLQNRCLWFAVGIILLFVGTLTANNYLFSPIEKKKKNTATTTFKAINLNYQLLIMLWWECKLILRQSGVFILLGFSAVALWFGAASAITHAFSLPTTDLLVHSSHYYFDKILILLIVWTAGDLIWRDKDYQVNDLIDAMPTKDIWHFLSKTLTLMFITLLFWVLAIIVNVLFQMLNGFYDFEFSLYLKDTFIYKAPYYLWMAILAISMQVIIKQRYIAIAIVLLIYLSSPLLDALGFYHPIYRYAKTPFFWYSMVDGYGHFWRGQLWFLVYWSAVALTIWLLACCLYQRGSEQLSFRKTLNQFKHQFKGYLRYSLLISSAASLIIGVAIIYQTVIQNNWPLFNENAYTAEIEKNYRENWGDKPQPVITKINGRIDIFPQQRRFNMAGELTLKNYHTTYIDEIIVFFQPMLSNKSVTFDQTAASLKDSNYDNTVQIWKLTQPLAPNQTIVLPFATASEPLPGFAAHAQHDGIDEINAVEIIGNGTALLNLNMMPAIGYSERLEHKPSWVRKKYGLSEQWQPPKGNQGVNAAHGTTHLGWLDSMNMIVSTSSDQIPLYAGEIVSDSVENDRRIIHYQIDRPNKGWSEVVSGKFDRYVQQRAGLPDVELYYHPGHSYNKKIFADHLHDAMAYFNEKYGKPTFETLKVAETAMHYNGMNARQGLVSLTEILAWKSDVEVSKGEDLRKFSSLFMGMHWWSDQITPANVPGAKILWSGLPYWASSLYLHASRPLALDRKIRIQDSLEMYRKRAKLEDNELPFIEEMKDSTMIRTKGSLMIVYLAELIGQEKLELIFNDFLQTWKYKYLPYPTSENFIQHLKNSIDNQFYPQLDDIFLHITDWQLEIISAEAKQQQNDDWLIKAKVSVKKRYTTQDGDVIPAEKFATPVPLFVFQDDSFNEGAVIKKKWINLKTGISDINITVSKKPKLLGLDPFIWLPDSNPYNNTKVVLVK